MKKVQNATIAKKIIQSLLANTWSWVSGNWVGIFVSIVSALIYFAPLIPHVGTYNPGGDAMFNAWTISRAQHCIMRDNCDSMIDGNIFYPNSQSLLFSESQYSTAFVALPLRLINDSPVFINNMLTILFFVMLVFSMYLLLKYLSKGNEFIASVGGLLFTYVPVRLSGIWHLQNLSFFVVPLIVLAIFKYKDTHQKRYLLGIFIAVLYQLYASWYQAVFAFVVIGVLLVGLYVAKMVSVKRLAIIVATIVLATILVLPLAKAYSDFGKQTKSGFSLGEQSLYSSNVADYLLPNSDTALGTLYYAINSDGPRNSFNTDSYSYLGYSLYGAVIIVTILAFRRRKHTKRDSAIYKIILTMHGIAFVGLLISLGPFLKLKGEIYYHIANDAMNFTITMPYIIVDKYLPQLAFMRALGRAAVIVLFAYIVIFAFLPHYLRNLTSFKRHKVRYYVAIAAIIALDLLPLTQLKMASSPYSYSYATPKVYSFIKDHDIDHIITLTGDDISNPLTDVVREQMLWAGYHNKYIFNGHSGYLPPSYLGQLIDYTDFQPDDVTAMKSEGLEYVLVDMRYSKTRPSLASEVQRAVGKPVYADSRYYLFKL